MWEIIQNPIFLTTILLQCCHSYKLPSFRDRDLQVGVGGSQIKTPFPQPTTTDHDDLILKYVKSTTEKPTNLHLTSNSAINAVRKSSFLVKETFKSILNFLNSFTGKNSNDINMAQVNLKNDLIDLKNSQKRAIENILLRRKGRNGFISVLNSTRKM